VRFARKGIGKPGAMTDQHDTPTITHVTTEPPPSVPPTVVVQPSEPLTKSFHLGSFVAGFVTALVLGALALAVFLVVSDSDDDGNIQVDVPAVDVDTGG
jgi:hypothetical protein